MHRSAVSYQFDDVILNAEAFTVEKSGQVLALEPKSIRLLLYLVQNRSRAIDKEELLRNVWEDVAASDNALARVVAQLRKALGDDAKIARYIETVPTIGYRFVADVVELAGGSAARPAVSEPPPAALKPAPRNSPWLLVAASALALSGILAAVYFLERARPSQPLWSGTLVGGSLLASHPRVSPDGQLLAFRAIVDGQSQVAVIKPGSYSWTALTHDRTRGAVASLAWSRDGSKIYFDREWGPRRIYSIGALGGEPRFVLDNAWIPEPLPDGSLIAQRRSADGREQLIHFWPDSGRTQALPATVQFSDSSNVRAFPDGREIAVFGLPANAAGRPRLFTLDLQSLRIRNISVDPATGDTLHEPIAVTENGVLIERRRNDTVEVVALPRVGSAPLQTLFSLPAIAAPISQDVAPDGSIYMDHSGFAVSILTENLAGTVQAEIPLPQLAALDRASIGLPSGAVVFSARRQGRSVLFIGRKGVEPEALLNTKESAGLPGALLGSGEIAFIIGAEDGVEDQPHIAIASLHDGHLIRRFPADARFVTAITAPADGETIFYASSGIIWAQPVSGGNPRKIGEGYDLAVDPSGKFLCVVRAGVEGYQLFRMPVSGGEAVRMLLPEGFNLTPLGLSPSAINRAGLILLPVNVLDLFFYQAAVFDPARNTMKVVPAPPGFVVNRASWTSDGGINILTTHWSSSLWHYRNAL